MSHSASPWRRLWSGVAALPRRIVRSELSPVAQQLSQQMHELATAIAAVRREVQTDVIKEELKVAVHTVTAEMTIQLSAYYQDLGTNGGSEMSEVLIKLENLERAVTALAQRIDVMDQGSNPSSQAPRETKVAR